MSHPITEAILRSHRAVLEAHGINSAALPLEEMARNAAQAVLTRLECGDIRVQTIPLSIEDSADVVTDAAFQAWEQLWAPPC